MVLTSIALAMQTVYQHNFRSQADEQSLTPQLGWYIAIEISHPSILPFQQIVMLLSLTTQL
jgi:hypothetical protein